MFDKLTCGSRMDLCDAFSQDVMPHFPLPKAWKQTLEQSTDHHARKNPRLSAISRAWLRELPGAQSWISIFNTLCQFSAIPELSPQRWIGAILHSLLHFRPLRFNVTRAAIIEEVSRIGTLLFLAPIWRTFSSHPVTTAALRNNLLVIIKAHFALWGELRPLLLWILFHSARESEQEQERNEFLVRMAMISSTMGIQSGDEMLNIVLGVLLYEPAGRSSQEAVRKGLQNTVDF